MEFASSSCDVLINFTGEDICRKFVSHLDSALSAAGFTTFLHQDNLVNSMQLQHLTQPKELCRIAIVVFTKTYAESAWCLHELQQIIKWHETYCRHVLPVYYEIQPSDVRLQKGDFGKALKATAQQTFSGQQVEDALSRWSRALTKAANLFGWDERNYRSDAELVDKIVKNVLYLPVLAATKFPVGLESHVEKLIRYIENTKVSIIGIWGMRGFGKATVAKAVYNQIHDTFVGYVTEILNGCGLQADIGIAVLIQRSLLKVEKKNKLGMHHLLREMGREIIRRSSTKEREQRIRLFADEAKFVLTKNNGTAAIQGLTLKSSLPITYWLEIYAFQNKEILRLLELYSQLFTRDYRNLSKQLRWICHRGFPLKYIPNNCNMEGAIAVDLKYSNLRCVGKQPWVLGWLKFLNLSHSKYLTETPDFSGLPSLKKLILKDCPSLCKVHQSIGDLCNLLLINLKDCISLSNLPKEVYKLKSLKTLILSGCSKIHILEKDIVKIESLITLIAENNAVKQVPLSIVSSKCIGYVSLRGFEGLSHKIYPSIIRSWISHNIRPFSTHMENNNWRDLSPLFSSLANLRSVLVQCDTEFQLSKQVRTTLVECGANVTKLRTSEHHLRFSLIGVGSYNEFFNTLSDSIHEGLARSESSYVCLPGDNCPYWLAHVGEGHSVCFTMPQDCDVKGMALCVVYLSTPDNLATECLTSVLIVNYTKCTFHIHKHGTVISFDDRDWEGIMSNLESGDKVEIFVTLAHGLVVKNTAVYLIYADPNDLEMEACHQPNKNVFHKFLKEIVTCDFKSFFEEAKILNAKTTLAKGLHGLPGYAYEVPPLLVTTHLQ
ncbi:unnamed protein product [Sphenostylis stenocarpa]|uniref:TIR domain-containing protein n=1 Tax=Sphenostylis stenocarpa TaxID=92480 RepID=A0AA86VBJ7_9FABA|nr:unnamed protein product [Sphenostylis stenocarpa]